MISPEEEKVMVEESLKKGGEMTSGSGHYWEEHHFLRN